MKSVEELKRLAAHAACEAVRPGMVLGLGTGSTTHFALLRIGELLHAGRLTGIVGIPSSTRTEQTARSCGIPLGTLEEHPAIDLTIDGADEVDPELNLIKGGGGALLREKVIAQASRRNLIVVDESKLSPRLGTHWALPVEVVPFAAATEERFLSSLGAEVRLRRVDGRPAATDQGNWILDAAFGPIADPEALARLLDRRAGIVEHGLFLGLAHEVIVAAADGIRRLKPPS
ncbi:MAG: ribose-5-phosphate isomerase RpiA [Desulfobacterales bacterium]